MVFAILIGIVFLGGAVGLSFWLKKRYSSGDEQLKKNLIVLRDEIKKKQETLRELGQLCLGLVSPAHLEGIDEQLASAEEELRAEKGRLTITEAELEAVDIRLRELEELKRELEMSGIDAIRELELLRAQERDMNSQNEALRNQLRSAVEQLDSLLGLLASSAEAVEKLQSAKTELLEAESKSQWYEEQIAIYNQKYLGLKRAYDALDIEYAQLYEKQQSAAG